MADVTVRLRLAGSTPGEPLTILEQLKLERDMHHHYYKTPTVVLEGELETTTKELAYLRRRIEELSITQRVIRCTLKSR